MPLFAPPDIKKLIATKDVSGLIKALSYKPLGNQNSGIVRQAAAAALSQIGDPQAVLPLIAALRDSDDEVRRTAASAFGRICDARAVEPLIAALKDSSPHVRSNAAFSLSLIRDSRALEPLVNALADKDLDVLHNVSFALTNLGYQPEHTEAGTAYWTGRAASFAEGGFWSQCVEIGAPAVPPLIHEVTKISKNHRTGAAEALVQIGSPSVVPLIPLLSYNNLDVRCIVVKTLGEIGDSQAVEPLINLLLNAKGELALNAITALGKIGDIRAVESLIATLNHADEHLQNAATKALQLFDNPRAAKAVADFKADRGSKKSISKKATLKSDEIKDLTKLELPIGYTSISLVDSRNLIPTGQGGDAFQRGIQASNSNQISNAISCFEQAIKLGLDPLREGYANATIGKLELEMGNLNLAVSYFIKVLTYKQALYESVHDAAQYLGVIMVEVGLTKDAANLQSLSSKTSTKLGYSLSPAAAEKVRNLVWSQNKR